MRIEKAQFKNAESEDYRLVLMTDDFRCIEPVLEFSNYLVTQGYSPNTVDDYIRGLKVYFEWLESIGLSYLEAKPVDIGLYLQYLNGGVWDNPKDEVAVTIDVDPTTGEVNRKQERAANTINKMMSVVSSLYTYREKVFEELTSPCIMKTTRRSQKMYKGLLAHTGNLNQTLYSLHRVKVPKKMRRRLTPKEVEKFREGLLTFRDKLIFDVLYETGLRISELIGLYLEDYSEPDQTEKVGALYLVSRDKKKQKREGRKKTGDRVVHVPMELIFDIDKYVTQHRPYVQGSQLLFVSSKGKTKGRKIGRKSVEKLFRECSKRTGVNCLPHELRHTHISELKEAGFDSAYIAARVGNSTAQAVYTHITEVELRRSMDRFWAKSTNRDGEMQ